MAQPLSSKLDWPAMNPIIASALNPVIANPISNLTYLNNINLINGVTTINHGLGRMMLGWFLTDITAGVMVYRSAALNTKTLVLTSSGAASVSIGVF